MNCVGFLAFVQTDCYSYFSQCREKSGSCLTALYCLFQRALSTVPHASRFFSSPASPPLVNRSIKVGGIENAGNTCTFSTLLQEFAAEYNFYNVFFIAPLQIAKEETKEHFGLRKQLQEHLCLCVKEIRAGMTVKRESIIRLSNLLQKLGWNECSVSLWRIFLHKIAPTLFPIPLPSPYKLYDKVISLFSEAYDPSRQIVLLNKDSEVSFTQLFEQYLKTSESRKESNEHPNNITHTLWKVCVDPANNILPQEQFQIQEHRFTLKLVHAWYETPHGKHVVVYRKSEERWICCNDAQINELESLPSHQIYAVVYESQPQS